MKKEEWNWTEGEKRFKKDYRRRRLLFVYCSDILLFFVEGIAIFHVTYVTLPVRMKIEAFLDFEIVPCCLLSEELECCLSPCTRSFGCSTKP